MADLTQAAQGASRSIGRYFSVVSVLPSALLVAWVFLLVTSGAVTGRPDLRAALSAVTALSVGTVGALTATALALGVVLHPLQFAFVQFLEGYWGTTAIAQRCRRLGIVRLRAQVLAIKDAGALARSRLNRMSHAAVKDGTDPDDDPVPYAALASYADEAQRVTDAMPESLRDTMPTRLGNVLRFYERKVGAPYGLEAIQAMAYLSQVATPADMDYVDDQRSALDLAVRTTVVSLIAFVLTALPLLTDGVWLLLALVPWTTAYLSYRGAVVAADEYGRALGVVVALNRFALYERLRLPLPTTTRDERRQNERILNPMLSFGSAPRLSVTYTAPASSAASPVPAPPAD